MDIRNKLINEQTVKNNTTTNGMVSYLESQVERTEGALAGFSAMESLVQHPVRKELSRKLSDGSRSFSTSCTRIPSWEPSMTARQGAGRPGLLEEGRSQSGTNEERGPDVNTLYTT